MSLRLPRILIASGIFAVGFVATADAKTVIRGNDIVADRIIQGLLPDRSGGVKDGEWENEAIKSLYRSGFFKAVSVSVKDNATLVLVSENPLIDRLDIHGSDELSASRVMEASGLEIGRFTSHEAISDASLKIEKAYMAKGMHDTVVDIRETSLTGNKVSLDIHIEEGAVTPVAEIWFKGNESVSEGTLRSLLSMKETSFFNRIMKRDRYRVDAIKSERDAIERYYRSKGYLNARVLLSDIDRNEEGFVIGYVLEEGPKFTIGDIEVDATNEMPSLSSLDRLSGQTYTPRKIARRTRELEEQAIRSGYASPVVTPRETRGEDGNVDIRFTVDEGSKAYVERIEIKGNTVTREHVIRREIDLSEGDLLTRKGMQEAERRIRRLGIFSDVSLSAEQLSGDRVLVVVEVAEKKTGQFSFGGGYSTQSGALAEVGVSQGNLFGSGYGFNASIGRSDGQMNYGVSFKSPYLFGNRISAETALFKRGTRHRNDKHLAYRMIETGGLVRFDAPITNSMSVRFGYDLTVKQAKEIASPYANLVSAGSHVVSSVNYGVTFDTLDDAFSPRDGYRFAAWQELAGLGGDARYLKSEASLDYYSPVLEDADLNLRLAGSIGHIYGLGEPVRYLDLYQAGDTIVRGFSANGFGPYDMTSGFHVGGTMYASAKAELSVPAPWIPETYGIRNIAFVDVGNVWDPELDLFSGSTANIVTSSSPRASIGTGIQWDSPIGRIRADFALPISKSPTDQEQVFSFSGGTSF